MTSKTILIFLFVIYSNTIVQAESFFPLGQLSKVDQRDYWLPNEVNSTKLTSQFEQLVNSPVAPIQYHSTINIALIYPSADISDFWRRSYLALVRRLAALGIEVNTVEFKSRQVEHSLQTQYINEVLTRSKEFDFVIFGPSELSLQLKNIERLALNQDFETFIWAFHTPYKSLAKQPRMWVDFSSSQGAKHLCDYLINRLGKSIKFAMNRGIPGITDQQRSGMFKQCVEEQGDWQIVYEHFGQYQARGGEDGTNLIKEHYPEVTFIHNANTAMTLGSINALTENKNEQESHIMLSGWGGTGLELEMLRQGKLTATPVRLNDDLGVATAEAIKLTLLQRSDELPLVYLGRIRVGNDNMSVEQIDELQNHAFRYSGVKNK
ncbi:MAG: substrate-binding domain-containing protein [Kangiellaceae bacterium]